MSNPNHVFVGLPALIKNAAASDPIVSAGDNHISGIGFFDAITGGTVNRDDLGENFRNTNFLAVVGTQVYFYTAAAITDPDWTTGANWTELTNSDLTQALIDISNNAGNISQNTSDISNLQAADISLTNAINANTTDINTNASDISTNTGNITSNASGIATNAANISGNDTDIATNAGNIATNATAITTLDGQVVKKTDSIDELNDVDTTTVAPVDGEVLKWDSGNWVPGAGGGVVRVEVKNDTLSDLDKGDPVYVSGTHVSGKPTVELADNDGSGTYPAIGLLEDDIAAGAEGYAVVSGSIFNIDTSSYAAGDSLYISSVAGVLTNSRPTGATSKVQKVALVKKSHATSGSVIVMGAGRTNDVPNIANGDFWLGNASGVATDTNFDTAVGSTTAVSANTSGVSSNASNISTNTSAILGKVAKAGDTMTGFLTLHADPTASLHAATKEYVDTIAAAGLHYHAPVRVEEPGNLTATYNNGSSGVGATLTNSSTQTALVLDGVAMNLGDRVLIYEQTNAYENGIYTVTNVGSGSTNWVLTRATDANVYAPSDPGSLGQGDAFFVLEGNTGAGELYVMNPQGSITFGTTSITFTQVASTAVFTAGSGIDLTGTTFSIDNTVQLKPSEGAFVNGDKTKLDGIASGAEVNVQANWNEANSGVDSFIQNKPTLGTAAATDATDYATSAQGTTADNALQPGDNVTELVNNANYITSAGAPVQSVNTQTGSVVLDADDIDDTSTTNKFTTASDISKLSNIQAGATANSTDATLLDRANHTGTQTAATISNFDAEVSNNTSVAANTLKTSFPGFGTTAGTALEGDTSLVDSVEGLSGTLLLNAGSGISISDNGSDTITITSTTTGGATTSVSYARMIMSSDKLNGGANAQDYDGTTDVDVAFDTQDTIAGSEITTNTTNYTATVQSDGFYRLTANISFYSLAQRATPAVVFNVNGSVIPGESIGYIRASTGSNEASGNITRVVQLSANDTVNVCCHDESTASGSIFAEQGTFEIEKLEVAIDTDFSNITSTPTTLAGYGITDAPTATSDLTNDSGFITAANELDGIYLEVSTRTSAYSAGSFEGQVIKFGTGTTVSGKIYVLRDNAGASLWDEANANILLQSKGLVGLALGTSPTTNGLLVRGIASFSNSFTVGAPLYIDLNGGVITDNLSSHTTGDYVRAIGYSLSTQLIYLDPSPDFIELG